jgi:hypothetical protein
MKCWRIYGNLNFCDYIYISGFGVICDILGYHRFLKGRFFTDYLNVSVIGGYLVSQQGIKGFNHSNLGLQFGLNPKTERML